jgi:ABC-type branched-subunit amino acid transport system substrate-binding protein
MTRAPRFVAGLLALALVAAACGDDRDDDAAPTTTQPPATTAPDDGDDGTTTTEPTAPGEQFGDLAWPCGPGDGEGNADSDVGVTADSITIGAGDDRGYAAAPGLNKEQTDAVEALVAKCNELGGINGRTIEVRRYDAAILNVVNTMTQACEDDLFMLVGQGFALDSNQEEARLGCGLPTVPVWSVSAAFAHAPLMIQPVPNPADRYHTGIAAMLAQQYPDRVGDAAVMYANYSATIETKDKVVLGYPTEGWDIKTALEYNIGGEDDWTPFVLQLKQAGSQIMYFSGSCLPNFQAFMQAAKVNELDIVVAAEANFYEDNCAEANADGAMDGLYVKVVFIPFEEADRNKATKDYVDIVTDNGGETSLLGAQAASSFLLWASAVRECGADLTRDCVLSTIAGYQDWTAGGLHSPSDPASNLPVECGVLMRLVGTTYERVFPEEPGTYDCDLGATVETPTVWVEQARLDENRVSQAFAGG